MMNDHDKPWYRQLNRYHWFVLLVAALGWLFDCLDQQLFVLARPAAMIELVDAESGDTPSDLQARRRDAGDIATSVFIVGWACGGLIFGVLGDRYGRAKTMILTILLYSLFTGLSAFSTSVADFAVYRFLTGLGVGGEFAVGVALVAEVIPASARPYSLALLQALSAVGNISAALINLGFGLAEEQGMIESPWRIMFMVGAVPALLTIVIRARLKEPEAWLRARHDDAVKKKLGSYAELFQDPVLRKHALLGLVLGCSGVVGLWSIGFYTPDLIRDVQRREVIERVLTAEEAGADAATLASIGRVRAALKEGTTVATEDSDLYSSVEKQVEGRLKQWGSYASMAINIGAMFGMFGFGALAQRIGRKPTFAIALISAFIMTLIVFLQLKEFWQIWVLVPIMGFCQLSLFAGYAIYFPELFPTRLRSTGTSFCYNVGRFVAALGPIAKLGLNQLFKDSPDPLRYTGATMCGIFLMGLLVLPFLPETKGRPLPE